METIQKLKQLPLDAARYAGHQLLGGAWGELGERYGEAVGGLKPHIPTITFPESNRGIDPLTPLGRQVLNEVKTRGAA